MPALDRPADLGFRSLLAIQDVGCPGLPQPGRSPDKRPRGGPDGALSSSRNHSSCSRSHTTCTTRHEARPSTAPGRGRGSISGRYRS
jgi:hypothetical protein